ncbi:hypothetical protein QYE76_058040 [Lolium multiflorum]|uniref:F-box domain-containing protein n=1 Tax=Lolium multiflorum TaxID=4521 RepID=A0AAD8WPM0_LOLMU|nr:hypothetical protein QYE76_058040 [Lolium multiflorum]
MDMSDGNDKAICFPYDLLLDILARLPAPPLASCRRVCRDWRAIVDTHDLLLPYYFPRRDFRGIFVTKSGCRSVCSFFGPVSCDNDGYYKPISRRPVYPHMATIGNHCNGLLFLEDQGNYYVFNPATARYACLPCPSTKRHIGAMTLAFDPAVSLHYDVYLLGEDKLVEVHDQEWMSERHRKPDGVPSRTGQWGIREFTPGRCAPCHLYNKVVTSSPCYRPVRIIWTHM